MRHAFIIFMIAAICGCYEHPPRSVLDKMARSELTDYAKAINFLAADCGRDKVLADRLPDALYRDPGWKGWKGPYVDGRIPANDGWGTPYKFEKRGSAIYLISNGQDRRIGTADDIVVIARMPGIK